MENIALVPIFCNSKYLSQGFIVTELVDDEQLHLQGNLFAQLKKPPDQVEFSFGHNSNSTCRQVRVGESLPDRVDTQGLFCKSNRFNRIQNRIRQPIRLYEWSLEYYTNIESVLSYLAQSLPTCNYS